MSFVTISGELCQCITYICPSHLKDTHVDKNDLLSAMNTFASHLSHSPLFHMWPKIQQLSKYASFSEQLSSVCGLGRWMGFRRKGNSIGSANSHKPIGNAWFRNTAIKCKCIYTASILSSYLSGKLPGNGASSLRHLGLL